MGSLSKVRVKEHTMSRVRVREHTGSGEFRQGVDVSRGAHKHVTARQPRAFCTLRTVKDTLWWVPDRVHPCWKNGSCEITQ